MRTLQDGVLAPRDTNAVTPTTDRTRTWEHDGRTYRLNDPIKFAEPGEFRFQYVEESATGRLVVAVHEMDGSRIARMRFFHAERVRTRRTTTATAEKVSPAMSTKMALRLAEYDAMTLKQLTEAAKNLHVAGYTKLTKKADLLAAVKQAGALVAVPNGDEEKAPRAPRERQTLASSGDIEVGTEVVTIHDVNLTMRNKGFIGTVPKDSTGTVKELRKAAGGVQVVIDFDDLGEVYFGIRHVEPAEVIAG